MTILRQFMVALLTVATLATGVANAASTTNFSDQWWIEAESGWGASVLQQADILFIDLFVYGADNKPTWFTAAASNQSSAPAGHTLFTGDLYQTNGPYFGGAFNSSAVSYAKVGTLTFDADTTNTAKMTYTVNGVPVVKNVTRQTWRYENLSGSYYGGFVWDQPCEDGTDNDHNEIYGSMQITQSTANAIRIDMQITTLTSNGVPQTVPANWSATMTGPYTQSGHMGQIRATIADTETTDTMVWTLFEIERTINGITGRLTSEVPGDDCKIARRYDGRFGGVRR
jgi:hypothetical protein